ncbi:MAG: hypothetical protein HYY16_10365 [Planctomycetes bacterium]|nr:hypothetical protein [Planctomycetota bacterium]
MSLRSQSWVAASLVTSGLLGRVASGSMRALGWLTWPSAGCVGIGLLTALFAVRAVIRHIAGQSARVESVLEEAARAREADSRNKTGGESVK